MNKFKTIASASAIALMANTISPAAYAQTAPIMAYGEKGPVTQKPNGAYGKITIQNSNTTHVNVNVGKSEVIDLPYDAADIFVANPAVVSAVIKSARRLFLVGTATGTSAVYIMDTHGNRFANLDVRVTQDLTLLNEVLRQNIPGSKITTYVVGAMVVLQGEVDNVLEAAKAVEMANAFLQPTQAVGANTGMPGSHASPQPGMQNTANTGTASNRVINNLVIRGKDQVMLRVTIAEVNRNVLKQLGIQTDGKWTIGNTAMNFASPATGLFNPMTGNSFDASNSSRVMGPDGLPRNSRSATFNAMEQNGLARLLAEPTLTAMSGEAAVFNVGGEIPVPSPNSTGTTGGTNAPTVEFKPFGISLGFTPVVLSGGRISLRIKTSVSDIDQSIGINIPAGTNGETMLVPGFRARSSETTVELPSGGSLMTAGLIQQNSRTSLGGVPGVSSLPIIGALARSRDYTRQETELMITVTPYIAKSVNNKDLARPDNGLRDASDVAGVALGQANVVNATRKPKPVAPAINGAGFIIK